MRDVVAKRCAECDRVMVEYWPDGRVVVHPAHEGATRERPRGPRPVGMPRDVRARLIAMGVLSPGA